MQQPSVIHNTFIVERSYPKPPQVVFSAFADPATKRRWFASGENHEVEEFEMDFRVGGVERSRYRFKAGTPIPGMVVAHDGTFQDIIPDRRIVLASSMDFAGKRVSTSLVTIELLSTATGTDLICTHQGAFYEGADGPEMREEGWRTLLTRLGSELS